MELKEINKKNNNTKFFLMHKHLIQIIAVA